MNSGERSYGVLIVSNAAKLNSTLREMLSSPKYEKIDVLGDIGSARRACASGGYDFIIINSPLPDDTGIRFSIDLTSSGPSIVLLMVRAEFYSEIL